MQPKLQQGIVVPTFLIGNKLKDLFQCLGHDLHVPVKPFVLEIRQRLIPQTRLGIKRVVHRDFHEVVIGLLGLPLVFDF